MTDLIRAVGSMAIAMCTTLAAPAAAQEFDLEPLTLPAAFPTNGLPRDWHDFRAFLETPEARATDLTMLREHLYAIISADAKARVDHGEPPYPQDGDTTLAEKFEWAGLMGLPGAGQVAAALRGTSAAPDESIETPGFEIRFDSAYTLVSRQDGWAVRFPHYFMIGAAVRQPMTNEVEGSIAMISTLFAAHTPNPADELGASQATLLVMSAAWDPAEMTAYWLDQFGLSPNDTVDVPDPSAIGAYRGRAESVRMNMEFAVFAPSGRTIVVGYMGVDGTYESNRPHYLNLLRTLRVRPGE